MKQELTLRFGSGAIKYEGATSHFAVIGAPQSGKTTMIRLLMQSVFELATNKGVPARMLVYDSKGEMLPVLHGMFEHLGRTDAEEKITLLDPFDRRGAIWDLAADITRPAHIQGLGAMLIQAEDGEDLVVSNSARVVLENIVSSFIEHSPRRWTLRDLCLSIETDSIIEAVLKRSTHTEWVLGALFQDAETTAKIVAKLTAAMKGYRDIAAIWDNAVREGKNKQFNLRQWLQSDDGILVFRNSKNRVEIDAINQLFFRRFAEIILDEQGELAADDLRRTWIILDGFPATGPLDGAVDLAAQSRRKGIAFVLGFQDSDRAHTIHSKDGQGREVAGQLLNQCSNLALLRMSDPDTAKWASDRTAGPLG